MRDIDELAVKINQTARDHGFWDKERNFGEMLMLVTSELAEALEEDRNGKPSVYWKCPGCGWESLNEVPDEIGHYIPMSIGSWQDVLRSFGLYRRDIPCGYTGKMKPEGALVEIADAIIRLCDTGQAEASKTRFTLGWVIEHKMEYNAQRERMHGKAY